MTGPYATAADTYWKAGWRGVLPLPERAKKYPPKTYTGAGGIDPSYPDVFAWVEGKEGRGNIALRLPLDVIGIDVDAYDDKAGAETLAAAERAHGALPATWRTTSRDDGVSGIRLYRVPPGMAWEQIGDGIETIQRNHRYAVVWPSLHPEGRTYRWIDPSGVVSTVIPHLDELPSLPDAWITAYVKGEAADVPRNDMPTSLAAAWLAGLPGAAEAPCQRMSEGASADIVTLEHGRGSAHDAGCQATARFVRLAAEGHSGVLRVMAGVHQAFIDNVTNPRRAGKHVRSRLEAEAEWRDLIVSAVNLVSADMPPAPSCDCTGQLTALIVEDRTRPNPTSANLTQGTAALATQPDTDSDHPTDAEVVRTSWWPRDLTPVLSGEQTEPPPTVLTRSDGQPLWYAGKINGLIGESESGKTWVALLGVAQELDAGNRVLYLDFEDAAPGIVSRLKALGVADDLLRTLLDYADPAESLNIAATGDLGELLRTRTYSLIVVDGLNAAMTLLGLDLMSNTDVTKFFQLLMRPLANTGSTVAYVDHIGKNAADDAKGGIGAQAKRAMTTGCVLKVKVSEPFGRGMTGRLGMTVDKDRAGHVRGASGGGRNAGVARLASDLASGRVAVTLEAPDMATPKQRQDGKQLMLMERISAWLGTNPARTSKNEIRKAVEGKNDDVEAALGVLVRRGFVHQAKVGSGFSHSLIKPYFMAEDVATDPDLARSPHLAPTSPRAKGPRPSDDLARSPHPYRWGEGESTEAGDAATPESDGVRPATFETVNCGSCRRPTPKVTADTFEGNCGDCAREIGLLS